MNNRADVTTGVILYLGIVWGIASLLIGLAASFTLNDNRLFESLLALVCGFVMPLPMAILAMRKPAISAIVLLTCLALLEGLGARTHGLRGVVLVAQRFAIQNIAFAWGYVYIWASRGTKRAGDGTVNRSFPKNF